MTKRAMMITIQCPHCNNVFEIEAGTPFSKWLRDQPEISSKLGYITNNIDYVWENFKKREWMLIEEKQYRSSLSESQVGQFYRIYQAVSKEKEVDIKKEPKGSKFKEDIDLPIKWKFKGFHLLQFEITNPEDGRMWLNGELIEKDKLFAFLRFDIYRNGLYFEDKDNTELWFEKVVKRIK